MLAQALVWFEIDHAAQGSPAPALQPEEAVQELEAEELLVFVSA